MCSCVSSATALGKLQNFAVAQVPVGLVGCLSCSCLPESRALGGQAPALGSSLDGQCGRRALHSGGAATTLGPDGCFRPMPL